MKFDVIIGSIGTREFKKATNSNGQDCIIGTPKGSGSGEQISVIYQDNKQVETYPSTEPGKVLYPVNKGDYICVIEKKDGTLWSLCYRVTSISDTKVIGSAFPH